MGLAVLISGLIKLQHAVDLFRAKIQGSILLFLMAVISIILGVLAIVNPFEAAATLIMIIGAGLLISGITDIFSGIYFLRKVNDYKKNS